jgi:hypothetical protein
MQLQQKVAALMCENEELVAQKEYSETQSGQVSRKPSFYLFSYCTTISHPQNYQEQSRQLAELQAQLKTKEVGHAQIVAHF